MNVAIVAMDLTLDGEAITYLSGGSPAKVVPRSPWVVCRFGYLSPQCLAKAALLERQGTVPPGVVYAKLNVFTSFRLRGKPTELTQLEN